MRDRSKHKRIEDDLVKLRTFLNQWDPMGLIAMGTPEDEYNPERDRVYGALASGAIHSADELARSLAHIFTDLFGEDFTQDDCSPAARTIWEWWSNRQ